ncbi:MAG TPA: HD domain-containing phosphohydrolase [Burkholderiaceae bacterium]|nr:HD domain-containing phosphohydrolase [Burkholderiaceae bacterium]
MKPTDLAVTATHPHHLVPSPSTATTPKVAPVPTVMLVDDEPVVLAMLTRAFQSSGYRVLTAESAALALAQLANTPADVVIADIRMPIMGGAECLKRVREQWPMTMRAMLTGAATVPDAIAAARHGDIHRYIVKPWINDDLLLTVRQLLDERRHLIERHRLEHLVTRQHTQLTNLRAELHQKLDEEKKGFDQATEKLRTSFFTAVRVFAHLLEPREGELAGHSRRVADLARRLARQMGLGEAETNEIFIAGLLHDIGKVGLPSQLWQTPNHRMTPYEREQYRKHPLRGERALMALDELRGAAKLLRSHHERYDGRGFPDSLCGDDIPMGARILALANDFDDVLYGHHHPTQKDKAAATASIEQGRGTRYDPAVVDALLALAHQADDPDTVHHLSPAELKPGMVLAHDLVSNDGVLLLAMDQVLDDTIIRCVRDYQRAERVKLVLHVMIPREDDDAAPEENA